MKLKIHQIEEITKHKQLGKVEFKCLFLQETLSHLEVIPIPTFRMAFTFMTTTSRVWFWVCGGGMGGGVARSGGGGGGMRLGGGVAILVEISLSLFHILAKALFFQLSIARGSCQNITSCCSYPGLVKLVTWMAKTGLCCLS